MKEVSEDWIEDCLKFHGRILNGENAHWCLDWDFLPIDSTCEAEMECCCCNLLPE